MIRGNVSASFNEPKKLKPNSREKYPKSKHFWLDLNPIFQASGEQAIVFSWKKKSGVWMQSSKYVSKISRKVKFFE